MYCVVYIPTVWVWSSEWWCCVLCSYDDDFVFTLSLCILLLISIISLKKYSVSKINKIQKYQLVIKVVCLTFNQNFQYKNLVSVFVCIALPYLSQENKRNNKEKEIFVNAIRPFDDSYMYVPVRAQQLIFMLAYRSSLRSFAYLFLHQNENKLQLHECVCVANVCVGNSIARYCTCTLYGW